MAYDMSEYNEISSVKTSNNEVFNFADTSLRETVSQLSSSSSTITIDGDVSDLSIANVTIGEYKQILSTRTILSNELYVIRNEGYVDAYGEKIKNVAPGIELSDAVNVEQLSVTATDLKAEIKDYVDNEIQGIQIPNDLSDLENSKHFVISSEISARLAEEYSKVFIDNHLSSVSKQTDLSIIVLSSSEYNQLVTNDSTLSDALYIVENDNEDMYNQRIINLAPGVDLSDAVNKSQLDAVSNAIPTDLSDLTNSPGYTANVGTITGIIMNGASKGTSGNVDLGTVLTAHQSLSNYYQTSETSSNIEIDAAVEQAKKTYFDDRLSDIAGYDELSVVKLSANEYEQLVASDTTLSNTLYIVEDNFINAYDQQIKNLAFGTDLSDAVTVEQLNNVLSGHTYDLNINGELTKMVIDLIEAFGGTVLNNPFNVSNS